MDRKASSFAVDARPGIVDVMLRWICCGIALMLSLFSAKPAHADAGTPRTTWICWHDAATTMSCHLSADVENADELLADSGDAAATRVPDSVRPLPRLARTILDHPEQLQGRRITIPMFSEPEEREFMIQLAEAVMCGVRTACNVEFLRTVSEIALAQDALTDPAMN